MTLQWRQAVFQDRQALEKFVCADPSKRNYDRHRGPWHPRPWEIEVQSHIRGMRPPLDHGTEVLLLGLDEVGPAAAVHLGFDDDDGEQLMIWAIGRATRCVRKRYGREALDVALQVCRDTKERHQMDCAVFTRIDPRNDPSRAMALEAGFEYLGEYEGGYQSWYHLLE